MRSLAVEPRGLDSRGKSSLPRPRLSTVWAVLAIGLPALAVFVGTIGVIDLAYQIRAGNIMLDTHSILTAEIFSFVGEGGTWLNQQWGSQVLIATAFRAGGFSALQVLQSFLVGGVAALLYLTCRRRGADARTSAVCTITALVLSFPTMGMRPQLFGVLAFAAFLYILSVPHRRALLWTLPVLSIVWANTHGSFFFIPILFGFALAESWILRRNSGGLIPVAALSVGATLLNPFGLDVWRYVIDLATNPVVRTTIREWQPVSVATPFGWAFFTSVFVVFALVARRRTPVTWVQMAWLALAFGVGLMAVRGMAWWGLIAASIVATLLAESPASMKSEPTGSPSMNRFIIGTIVIGWLVLAPWTREPRLDWAPEKLVATVRDTTPPGTRLFVAEPWGSWFEFRLPSRPVFVDPRIEVFPAEVWRDYHSVLQGRADWPAILERWDVDVVAAETDWPVVDFMRADPDWTLVTENEEGAVFARDALLADRDRDQA